MWVFWLSLLGWLVRDLVSCGFGGDCGLVDWLVGLVVAGLLLVCWIVVCLGCCSYGWCFPRGGCVYCDCGLVGLLRIG